MWFGERSNAPLQSSSMLHHSLQALWSGHFVCLFVFPCRVRLRKRGVVPRGLTGQNKKLNPCLLPWLAFFPLPSLSYISHSHGKNDNLSDWMLFCRLLFHVQKEFEIFWWTYLLSSLEFALHFCIGTCVSLCNGKPKELDGNIDTTGTVLWSYQQQPFSLVYRLETRGNG